MSLLATQPGLLQALSHEMTPKFLATRSTGGIPNVVPCTSIMPAGDVEDRLILGNFLLHKSASNLDADPRVGILVMTTDLEVWMLQGEFLAWQRTGDYGSHQQHRSAALQRLHRYSQRRRPPGADSPAPLSYLETACPGRIFAGAPGPWCRATCQHR